MSNIIFIVRLTDEGDFAAVRRAEFLLQAHGFSVGTMQRGSYRGILFGNYEIQKWRNLNVSERAALHGILDGDRCSHAQIEIWDSSPIAAVRALADSLEGQPSTDIIKRPPLVPSFPKISPTDVTNCGTHSYSPSVSEGEHHA
jgi:hypothetical protein